MVGQGIRLSGIIGYQLYPVIIALFDGMLADMGSRIVFFPHTIIASKRYSQKSLIYSTSLV